MCSDEEVVALVKLVMFITRHLFVAKIVVERFGVLISLSIRVVGVELFMVDAMEGVAVYYVMVWDLVDSSHMGQRLVGQLTPGQRSVPHGRLSMGLGIGSHCEVVGRREVGAIVETVARGVERIIFDDVLFSVGVVLDAVVHLLRVHGLLDVVVDEVEAVVESASEIGGVSLFVTHRLHEEGVSGLVEPARVVAEMREVKVMLLRGLRDRLGRRGKWLGRLRSRDHFDRLGQRNRLWCWFNHWLWHWSWSWFLLLGREVPRSSSMTLVKEWLWALRRHWGRSWFWQGLGCWLRSRLCSWLRFFFLLFCLPRSSTMTLVEERLRVCLLIDFVRVVWVDVEVDCFAV